MTQPYPERIQRRHLFSFALFHIPLLPPRVPRHQVRVLSRAESSKRGLALCEDDTQTAPSPLTDVEVVIIKDT